MQITNTMNIAGVAELMGEASREEAAAMIEILCSSGHTDTDDIPESVWLELCARAVMPDSMVGLRVELGSGDDHDTGRVESVEGSIAFVAWDSGVKTMASVAQLRVL